MLAKARRKTKYALSPLPLFMLRAAAMAVILGGFLWWLRRTAFYRWYTVLLGLLRLRDGVLRIPHADWLTIPQVHILMLALVAVASRAGSSVIIHSLRRDIPPYVGYVVFALALTLGLYLV